MNCNVKDYLILKGDFDFAIPWITLPQDIKKPFEEVILMQKSRDGVRIGSGPEKSGVSMKIEVRTI